MASGSRCDGGKGRMTLVSAALSCALNVAGPRALSRDQAMLVGHLHGDS
jgi:hypothetical protein